jgi:hypothetical protein
LVNLVVNLPVDWNSGNPFRPRRWILDGVVDKLHRGDHIDATHVVGVDRERAVIMRSLDRPRRGRRRPHREGGGARERDGEDSIPDATTSGMTNHASGQVSDFSGPYYFLFLAATRPIS